MDTTQVMDLVRDAVCVAIKLSAPMLLLSMLVAAAEYAGGRGGGDFPGGDPNP